VNLFVDDGRVAVSSHIHGVHRGAPLAPFLEDRRWNSVVSAFYQGIGNGGLARGKALVHIYALRSLNDFGRWVIKSKKSHSVLIGWLVK